MPPSYEVLYELLGNNGEKYLTAQLMNRIVKQAQACFEAIGKYGYVYTDFSSQNIMVDAAGEGVALIDLDSAWAYATLEKNKGMFTGQFDSYFWLLWYKYLLPARLPSLPSPTKLPMTMVLSFAVIWIHALSLLQTSPDEAIELIRDPAHDKQRELWEALQKGDQAAFEKYFRISPHRGEDLFEEWRDIFRELVSARPVSWTEIHQAARSLAAVSPQLKSQRKAANPSDTSWEPPPFPWRTIGLNLVDPFRIFTLGRRLVGSRSARKKGGT
jgi:hypothetical protein